MHYNFTECNPSAFRSSTSRPSSHPSIHSITYKFPRAPFLVRTTPPLPTLIPSGDMSRASNNILIRRFIAVLGPNEFIQLLSNPSVLPASDFTYWNVYIIHGGDESGGRVKFNPDTSQAQANCTARCERNHKYRRMCRITDTHMVRPGNEIEEF